MRRTRAGRPGVRDDGRSAGPPAIGPPVPGDGDWPSLGDVADAFGDLSLLIACYLARADSTSREHRLLREFGAIICTMELGLRGHP